MNEQQKVKYVARLLHNISRDMENLSYYMNVEGLNLENYPDHWNSFDDMAVMLQSVFVFSESDLNLQERAGDN